jgi:BirA family biotin operon repressor/biotin-[acetyl-CoA-carboxylase] ligase
VKRVDVISRLERFELVASTNDLVSGWLRDGVPEVCVAVADRQSAGRGRLGRTWQAPAGAALLASLGFRPGWLAPDRAWRLAAVVALAAADASEHVAGLPDGTIRLKWPNDLVVAFGADNRALGGAANLAPDRPLDVRKLAGLLGESDGLGGDDPTVVVGLGLNADWPAAAFPPELAPAMTSLREASGGRPIDRDDLLDAFLDRMATRAEALRSGYFDLAGWHERQLTAGRLVRLDPIEGRAEVVRAVGVDGLTGALLVEDEHGRERNVLAGEIHHLRLAAPESGDLPDPVRV